MFKGYVSVFYLFINLKIKYRKELRLYFNSFIESILKVYRELYIMIRDNNKEILFFSLYLFNKSLNYDFHFERVK